MITVLLFAHLREQVGKRELTFELASATVAELKQLMQEQYPALPVESVMVAINEEFAIDSETVQSGDIVAFIPPVSGG